VRKLQKMRGGICRTRNGISDPPGSQP
jgi:hypothetical protein